MSDGTHDTGFREERDRLVAPSLVLAVRFRIREMQQRDGFHERAGHVVGKSEQHLATLVNNITDGYNHSQTCSGKTVKVS